METYIESDVDREIELDVEDLLVVELLENKLAKNSFKDVTALECTRLDGFKNVFDTIVIRRNNQDGNNISQFKLSKHENLTILGFIWNSENISVKFVETDQNIINFRHPKCEN